VFLPLLKNSLLEIPTDIVPYQAEIARKKVSPIGRPRLEPTRSTGKRRHFPSRPDRPPT
jgi:hypothetical protein